MICRTTGDCWIRVFMCVLTQWQGQKHQQWPQATFTPPTFVQLWYNSDLQIKSVGFKHAIGHFPKSFPQIQPCYHFFRLLSDYIFQLKTGPLWLPGWSTSGTNYILKLWTPGFEEISCSSLGILPGSVRVGWGASTISRSGSQTCLRAILPLLSEAEFWIKC